MTASPPKNQSLTKSQLAAKYNICRETLNTWLIRAEIHIPKNIKILNPEQIKTIFEKIGEP